MFKNTIITENKEEQEYIFLIAHLAEINEWDNRCHLERIKRYIYLLASELGFTDQESKLFSIAGLLHDLGKISLPADILKKTGKLEPHEWKINEKHTITGAKILNGYSSSYFKMGELIALSHHERWDGSGYPHGTKGDEIPISARICAVADVFDALTSKRSYKQEIADEEAYNLIYESSGILFDPEVIKAFIKNYKKLILIKNSVNEKAKILS